MFYKYKLLHLVFLTTNSKENLMENNVFNFFLGEKSKKQIEKVLLFIALFSFIIHLAIIYLNKSRLLDLSDPYQLFTNPITAIYTPFSFILIYEIYLLIYYLPRSITTYISKQYEIITLIVIRRIFKDISNIQIEESLFTNQINLQIFIDLGAAVILFFLIFLFRKNTLKSYHKVDKAKLSQFIRIKKWIAALMIPILFFLASFQFYQWLYEYIQTKSIVLDINAINNIFFDELFQVLVLVDVLLLLFSFFNSDLFHRILRNSGFIISTILIRFSFLTDGLSNVVLIISALLFGLLIQLIYNACERKELFKN